MLSYWLHRISHLAYISYPLLDSGFLSIGFSDMSNAGFLKRVTERGWGCFEEEFERTFREKSRSRYSLWRFIAGMKRGDYVLVPSWGTFSIYEIEEDSAVLPSSFQITEGFSGWNDRKISRDADGKFVVVGEESPVDIGFLRKVKLVQKDIPRDGYADSALTSRMKIRDTNADISDLRDNIKRSMDAFVAGNPIDLKSSLIDMSVNGWLERIKKDLKPDKFEKLVAKYLERVGAKLTTLNPDKNSKGKAGDVDVIGTFESIKTIVNVQAKFHDGETSDWAVRQIRDYAESKHSVSDGYSRVYWVVSSSDSFSEDAKKLAIEKGVLLFDGKQFVRMLMEAGIENIGDDE